MVHLASAAVILTKALSCVWLRGCVDVWGGCVGVWGGCVDVCGGCVDVWGVCVCGGCDGRSPILSVAYQWPPTYSPVLWIRSALMQGKGSAVEYSQYSCRLQVPHPGASSARLQAHRPIDPSACRTPQKRPTLSDRSIRSNRSDAATDCPVGLALSRPIRERLIRKKLKPSAAGVISGPLRPAAVVSFAV